MAGMWVPIQCTYSKDTSEETRGHVASIASAIQSKSALFSYCPKASSGFHVYTYYVALQHVVVQRKNPHSYACIVLRTSRVGTSGWLAWTDILEEDVFKVVPPSRTRNTKDAVLRMHLDLYLATAVDSLAFVVELPSEWMTKDVPSNINLPAMRSIKDVVNEAAQQPFILSGASHYHEARSCALLSKVKSGSLPGAWTDLNKESLQVAWSNLHCSKQMMWLVKYQLQFPPQTRQAGRRTRVSGRLPKRGTPRRRRTAVRSTRKVSARKPIRLRRRPVSRRGSHRR